MLLLHVVAPGRLPAPDGHGLRGQPLRLIEQDSVRGWATEWPTSQSPSLARDDLLEHHHLVERALASSPCLPVRLPTWLRDAAQLQTLGPRLADLERVLERVSGKRELAITALWSNGLATATPELAAEAGPGRHYLEQRRQELARSDGRREEARRLAREIEDVLGGDLVEARHTPVPSERVALSSALLVPNERAGSAVERLDVIRRAHDSVRILVNGPWPPYSFTELGEVRGT